MDTEMKKRNYTRHAKRKILDFLSKNASTNEEIGESLGMPAYCVSNHILELNTNGGLVEVYYSPLGKSAKQHSFNSYDIIGDLTKRQVSFLRGEYFSLFRRLVQSMPSELTGDMKKSITWRLIPTLPKETQNFVRDYMAKHANCSYPFDKTRYGIRIVDGVRGFQHHKNPKVRYALDFSLPAETPVLAAHDGIVLAKKSDSSKCFSSEDVIRNCWSNPELRIIAGETTNYVCTESEGVHFDYYPFKKDEIFVEEGQRVKTGDLLGCTGPSGIMDVPYLHVNSYVMKGEKPVKSIPIKFVD